MGVYCRQISEWYVPSAYPDTRLVKPNLAVFLTPKIKIRSGPMDIQVHTQSKIEKEKQLLPSVLQAGRVASDSANAKGCSCRGINMGL